MKVIGHPARWQIINLLRSGEECVCHLTVALAQRQAYVSQQLMFLRRAGVIVDRKEGLRVYYQVRDRRVFDLMDEAGKIVGYEGKAEEEHPPILANCPCPRCESQGAHKHSI